VLILGSGGTSKTALAVANAFDCASVMRVSRIEREDCITYDQAYANYGDAQILINATPCGMYPNLETISVDLDRFPKLEGVVDVVYNPLRTRFVCDAQSRGLKAVGGLYMLVAQAVAAAERFTGQTVDKRRVNEIYNRLLLDKENVVLVGMPGCGKTTVGKLLASLLGKTFLDIDELVVNKTGLSISELFNQVGEDGFRRIETEVIREIASKQGAVIATGGGAILRRENVLHLKQNGRIYFLDRAVEKLPVSEDRPLSATPLALQQRYKERYPIYSTVCDVRIEADGMPHEVANFIREDLLYANFGFERS
jgi:shikimate dehydrogenase